MADITHIPNVSVTITLDAAPRTEAGFGYVLLIAKKATSALDGDSIRTYTDAADAVADDTAGDISTFVANAVTVALSQVPRPTGIKVAWIDLVGTETYAAALARIRAVDDDFYGVCIEERTDAAILAIAAAVEATRKVCAVQTDEAGFYTATYPSALAALAAYERTAIVLHDTDAIAADVGWLANRLAYDPDVQSVPWDCPIQGVAANTAAPTAAGRVYAIGHNANVLLPYGGAPLFVDAGVNATGRPLAEILTADWFHARLTEDVAALKVNRAARGSKIPVSAAGQILILALVQSLFQRGVDAGHFLIDEWEAAAVAISDADTDAARLRFTGRAQLAVGARLFTFALNFSRSALT